MPGAKTFLSVLLAASISSCRGEQSLRAQGSVQMPAHRPNWTTKDHTFGGSTWAMYQLRPDHNAVLIGNALVRSPWRYDAHAKINGGMALAGHLLVFGTFGKNVVALDARDGTPEWVTHLDNLVMSTPVVYKGTVFIGTGDNGSLYASSHGFVYDSGPLSDQIDVWGRREGDHIVALRSDTGNILWRYRTMGEDMPSPALVGDNLVFANGDDHAYALRSGSGQAVWRQDLDGIATMASATTSRYVLVSVCGSTANAYTYALLPHTGAVKWRSPYGNCDASPTTGANRVFLSGVDGNLAPFGFGGKSYVAAVSLESGRLLWTHKSSVEGPYTSLGSNERAIAGTYASGVFYVAIPSEDQLVAFDAASGRIRWIFKSLGPIKMSPVVGHGKLYVGDIAGLLYTINSNTGELIHVRIFNKPFTTSPPLLVGSYLIIANDDTVEAIRVS